jgi:hypothetical protein
VVTQQQQKNRKKRRDLGRFEVDELINLRNTAQSVVYILLGEF